jgi:hypothetical protein
VVLAGRDGFVYEVAISNDSHWLVTISDPIRRPDRTARLWLLQVNDLIDSAGAIAGRNFSSEEWNIYFPGELYHKTFSDFPGP